MLSFKQYIFEVVIEPIKPVVPIQPELPRKPQQPKKPKEEETPEREPDQFLPTQHLPEFQPYKGFTQYLREVKFGPEFGPELANKDVGREFNPGGKFSYTSERAPHETTDPFNPHEHSELLMNFLHDNRMDDRLIAKGERLDRVSPRAQHYMGVIQDAKHHLTQFSNFTNHKGEKVIDPGVWKETTPYDEKDGSHHSHDLYALRLIAQLGSSRYARLGSPIDLRHHMRVMQDPEASDHQIQRARDGIENNQRELAMKTRIAKLLMSSKRARLVFASEVKQHYDRKGREELISKQDI